MTEPHTPYAEKIEELYQLTRPGTSSGQEIVEALEHTYPGLHPTEQEVAQLFDYFCQGAQYSYERYGYVWNSSPIGILTGEGVCKSEIFYNASQDVVVITLDYIKARLEELRKADTIRCTYPDVPIRNMEVGTSIMLIGFEECFHAHQYKRPDSVFKYYQNSDFKTYDPNKDYMECPIEREAAFAKAKLIKELGLFDIELGEPLLSGKFNPDEGSAKTTIDANTAVLQARGRGEDTKRSEGRF